MQLTDTVWVQMPYCLCFEALRSMAAWAPSCMVYLSGTQ